MERRNSNMGCPIFFKPFMPTVNSHQLNIPVMFLDHIIHENSRSFFLTGPSGNIWTVILIKETDDHYFFGEGWRRFVNDHALMFGDICVFIYEGNLKFKVEIFDRNGCAKESAFSAMCSQDCTHSKRDKEKMMRRNEAVKEMNVSSSGSRRERKANVTPADLKSGTLISQRRKVTWQEKQRAIVAAMEFESENKYQVMVMKPSHVYSGSHVPMPRLFMAQYLPVGQEIILIDPISGREWPVSYVVTNGPPMNRGWLSGGWSKFSYDNNIEADDVCVFELVKKNEMLVHIFRVVEEITPLIKHSSKKKRGNI